MEILIEEIQNKIENIKKSLSRNNPLLSLTNTDLSLTAELNALQWVLDSMKENLSVNVVFTWVKPDKADDQPSVHYEIFVKEDDANTFANDIRNLRIPSITPDHELCVSVSSENIIRNYNLDKYNNNGS